MATNCHGDFYQPRHSLDSVYKNTDKKILQQRRNSTSFSTIAIGGDTDFGYRGQKHGVITASALMDLRTSIR